MKKILLMNIVLFYTAGICGIENPLFLDWNYLCRSEDNVIAAQDIIRVGLDIHEPLGNTTPLATAVAWQRTAIAQELLELGADPNQATEDGLLPLMFAMNDFNTKLVELLLHYGADANAQYLDTGLSIAEQAIAISERYKNQQIFMPRPDVVARMDKVVVALLQAAAQRKK